MNVKTCLDALMYQGSAGYDFWAAETKTVIRLDLAVAIPEGCYGRIAGQSGLAKRGIAIHDRTIDSDYRGEVRVVLFNLSNEEYTVRTGNRIAQLIIEQYIAPKFVLVSEVLQRKIRRCEIRVLVLQEVFKF